MSYRKMTVDGKTIVAFQTRMDCDQEMNPIYIQRYVGLSGIKIKAATGQEYKKYKRTRKNRLSVDEQLNQIEMW